MDYGRLLRRAGTIVWDHKFLVVLGFLAALGGGASNSGVNLGSNYRGGDPGQMPAWRGFPFSRPFPGFEGGLRLSGALLLLLGLGLLVALLIFVVSNVARGSLIVAVDGIEVGAKPGLGEAWGAGWNRVRTLLGIGLIPALPFFFALLLALIGFLSMVGLRAVHVSLPFGTPFGGIAAALICFLAPISVLLGLLRTFANRAAMLEGMGALSAYARGFSVLKENVGEAFVLFLLQVAISIGLFISLALPGLIAALCCFLWPLLILFQGAVAAFFSSLWTLAWREWTGRNAAGDVIKSVA